MTKRSEVNYANLARGAKVVILGEVSHQTPSLQQEIGRSLQYFKRAGFTHFGMEMLSTDVNANNPRDAIDHISNTFGNGHAQVYRKAKQLNFSAISLDMPYEKQSQYPATESGSENQYLDRNKWMSNEIIKAINKGAKSVIYMHYGHSINGTSKTDIPDSNGIQSMLKNSGINTVNIQFIGGDWSRPNSVCVPFSGGRLRTSAEAQRDGVQNTLFSIPGNPKIGVEFIVHVPQNCHVPKT